MTYSLDELKMLCANAWAGPWQRKYHGSSRHRVVGGSGKLPICMGARLQDLEFIAAARTALPELIARVERLEESLHNCVVLLHAHVGPDDEIARLALSNARAALEEPKP
jgi:hypothetical protein